jgi:membrane-bound ClpP family serine protease
MIRNPRIRRTSAVIMVVLGAILMLIAPEVWQGALLLVLGVVLELVGIALEHKADKASD